MECTPKTGQLVKQLSTTYQRRSEIPQESIILKTFVYSCILIK